ncbi:MAG: S8 family serine peptidase [Synergistaceae bacterium]|nr:S8 family serine peptidase [Synergistaceae bacterium]
MRKILLSVIVLILACSSSFAGEFVKGDAIVVFKSNESVTIAGLKNGGNLLASVNAAVSSVNASVKNVYSSLSESDNKIFVHVHSDSKTTEQLITDLLKRDDVLAASPNKINRPRETRPNDKYYNQLWGLEKINAPSAWDTTTGSENIYVVVMDSGVYTHPDLSQNIAADYARDFSDTSDWSNDEGGHGTHVAGTIGAVGNNEIGVAGVNWNVKIIPIKIENSDGTMPDSNIINAFNYLTELLRDNPNMKIAAVNMSFGGYSSYTPQEAVTKDATYAVYSAFDKLNRCLMVAAAGNEGITEQGPMPFTQPNVEWEIYGYKYPTFYAGDYDYPISYIGLNNLIAVGSINVSNDAPDFTNFGDGVHVAAPGVRVLSTYKPVGESKDVYIRMSGNSMATPHVTGSIALLASAYPQATTTQLKTALFQGANSNINPLAYPYKYKCELAPEIAEAIVEQLISDDQIQPADKESEIQKYTNLIIDGLKVYESLDGKYKVSKYGLIDVNASLSLLAGFVANNEYLEPVDDESENIYTGSGPGGCNIFAGLFICAGLLLLTKK